jgi:hypothetical protein
MKRLILAVGGLLLATANTPPSTTSSDMAKPESELSSVVAAEAPGGAEPAAGPAAKPAKPKAPRIAVAPEANSNVYPRCSATVHDRCAQGRSYHAQATRSHRMQLAMRAGERG